MIKINLRPTTVVPEGETGEIQVDQEVQRKGYVNIMVMLIIPAALYVYGLQARPEKQHQITALTSQIAELTSFNEKQAAIVTEIQKIEKDEKDVENRIDALNKLTLGRQVEIKILDLLQSIIREKMWLKSIDVEGPKLNLEGMAQSEMDVSIFLEDLTKNVLLREVRLLESSQEAYEGQNFSHFKISAVLEKSK